MVAMTYPTVIPMHVQVMACSACGAEANASCNCGKPYIPAKARATEFAKTNPGSSIRTIAEKTGVSHATAQRAKADVSDDTPVTGRDGKTYRRPIVPVVGGGGKRDIRPPRWGREQDEYVDEFPSLDDDGRYAPIPEGLEAEPRINGFLFRAEQSTLAAETFSIRHLVPTDEMITAARGVIEAWTKLLADMEEANGK